VYEAIRSNDDVKKYRTARRFLDGEHKWLERGITPMADLDEISSRREDDLKQPFAAG
jgi:hypothetical protein